MKKNLGASYSPLYFLASLGNGGLAVAFYMYLMFMLPHKGVPMATFDHIYAGLTAGNLLQSVAIGVLLLLIVWLAFNHLKLLVWNVREYKLFKTTEGYTKLKSSNAEIGLMAMPLTFAMTINVLFVLGGAFVPGLWSVVELLFPFALIGFTVVGYYAIKIFSDYFVRLIIKGNFEFQNNNSLSQALAIFAFSMVSVGYAAPAAMSHNAAINAIGLFGSIFFAMLAVSMGLIFIVLGLKSILKQGISVEAAPSMWIFIPILTILGITFIRVTFGFFHNMLEAEPSGAFMFLITSAVISLQLMFGAIGYLVLTKIGYFRDYIHGDKNSAGSFALICPGVAIFVFGIFFLHWGLVYPNIVDKYSIVYFVILAPFVVIKLITLKTLFKLERKLLKS